MKARQAKKAQEERKSKKMSAVLDQSAPSYMSKSNSKPKKRSDSGARGSEQKEDSKKYDSSTPMKHKRIIRTKQNYINFYKTMTSFLSREHPKWTSAQIGAIVRLEWKKKKNSSTKLAKKTLRRSRKLTSAYNFYRRFRRFSAEEAQELWRRFPVETRTSWKIKAWDEEPEPLSQTKFKVVLKSDDTASEELRYLRNPIQ